MRKIKVLDKGFIQLVDYMGTDARVIESARVSYKGFDQEPRTDKEDEGLIRYMMENSHTSPFEHVTLTFQIKAPIFVARQWMRHRTASINELSGRYANLKEEFYEPELCDLGGQDTKNKQGRTSTIENSNARIFQELLKINCKDSYMRYQQALELGVARELARMMLPLNVYTEWFWTLNLHNLYHFIKLRAHPHAQWEINQYARALLSIVRTYYPISTKYFCRSIEE